MLETFNWGIIGPGSIADEFANDLRFASNARHRVGAVFSYKIEKAEDFAGEKKANEFFGSIHDFLKHASIDAAYIATPHPLHHKEALLCLDYNIPVLCEKPLGMKEEQVREIIDKSVAKNCFMMEGMWTRFLPSIQKVLELVEEGAIGDIKFIKANMSFKAPRDVESRYFDPGQGGGSLLDLGIYPAFLALLLLGNPTAICASASLTEKEIDESCVAILHYDKGRYAHLESSLVEKTDLSAFICGTKGNIRIMSPWTERPAGIVLETHNGILERFRCRWKGRGLQFEIEEVYECVRQGKIQSVTYPHEFSLRIARVLDEIRSQTGIVYPFD